MTSNWVLLADRQVAPLSLSVTRLMPTPASRTSSAPAVSSRMVRGFLKPLVMSCACQPGATTGRL